MLILFGYYSAPLSSLWTVIRTRNATSLYAPLAVAAICNGSLWTIYGLVLGVGQVAHGSIHTCMCTCPHCYVCGIPLWACTWNLKRRKPQRPSERAL